jgi:hypothetical protein
MPADLLKIGKLCLMFLSNFLPVGNVEFLRPLILLLVQGVRFADSAGVHRTPEIGGARGVVEPAQRGIANFRARRRGGSRTARQPVN